MKSQNISHSITKAAATTIKQTLHDLGYIAESYGPSKSLALWRHQRAPRSKSEACATIIIRVYSPNYRSASMLGTVLLDNSIANVELENENRTINCHTIPLAHPHLADEIAKYFIHNKLF